MSYLHETPEATHRAKSIARKMGADLSLIEVTRLGYMWREYQAALVFADGEIEYLNEGTEKEIELWVAKRFDRWKDEKGEGHEYVDRTDLPTEIPTRDRSMTHHFAFTTEGFAGLAADHNKLKRDFSDLRRDLTPDVVRTRVSEAVEKALHGKDKTMEEIAAGVNQLCRQTNEHSFASDIGTLKSELASIKQLLQEFPNKAQSALIKECIQVDIDKVRDEIKALPTADGMALAFRKELDAWEDRTLRKRTFLSRWAMASHMSETLPEVAPQRARPRF